MNQSLLEILLVFFSEPPKSESMDSLCDAIGLACSNRNEYNCENCVLGRCNFGTCINVHKSLDRIKTTIRVITNEHAATPNNK